MKIPRSLCGKLSFVLKHHPNAVIRIWLKNCIDIAYKECRASVLAERRR